MSHWHVGCNTPGYLPEWAPECVEDIELAAWEFRARLLRALDALPQESEVCGMDEEWLGHTEWLALRPDLVLIKELEAERWLGRTVHDGRCLPTVYWVGEQTGPFDECDERAGGGWS